ncbi:ChuX/HutX family heme-like substrate-binding protein [Cupriavidus basilensis]
MGESPICASASARCASARCLEAALVAAGCGVTAQELAGPAQTLFRELGTLGRVAGAVAQRLGRARAPRRLPRYPGRRPGRRSCSGPDIDLRMFFASWKYFYAVTENGRRSIQFFDMRGEAVHKVVPHRTYRRRRLGCLRRKVRHVHPHAGRCPGAGRT